MVVGAGTVDQQHDVARRQIFQQKPARLVGSGSFLADLESDSNQRHPIEGQDLARERRDAILGGGTAAVSATGKAADECSSRRWVPVSRLPSVNQLPSPTLRGVGGAPGPTRLAPAVVKLKLIAGTRIPSVRKPSSTVTV